jgi:lysozyme
MMNLRDWIIAHEGVRLKPYKCTGNKTSIGVGRNLDDNGITLDEAYFMLDNDIERCKRELSMYPWFLRLDYNRQDAIVNMCFNLGLPRLLGFKRMIAALERKDYAKAAIEALDSRWAQQVKGRATDIALVIREGK